MQCFVKFMEKTVEDIEISLVVSWRGPQNDLFSLKKFSFLICKKRYFSSKNKKLTYGLNDVWTLSW